MATLILEAEHTRLRLTLLSSHIRFSIPFQSTETTTFFVSFHFSHFLLFFFSLFDTFLDAG
ncbi:hypothetical protein P154DRAFT_189491 [Amniculicola lignicola CBS 123094]|uniref:Uncharacterized protein n=1 Tax=Amniculicola lignicola CBS 123094 TaxID=1392246 RepID=A0A6A5WG46_9PLEO|nr:hypothetical protein P154DRAFT_189491 [Amniculicola lignicola CBS 123094]